MKRYPHYWYPLRGKHCPQRIAVLAIDPPPGPAGRVSEADDNGVSSWQLSLLLLSDGREIGGAIHGGQTADSLWCCLSTLCSRRGTTWVFMEYAFDSLTAIGFWDSLDERRVRLVGKDWTTERGDGEGGEDPTDGLCCIEDPPTLVLCQVGNGDGKLLILDTRNYGFEPLDSALGIRDRCRILLNGIYAVLRTLREGQAVSLRGTAASQAVQILRTRHDCCRLHCHTHPGATALERAAYFGGRVEVYRAGVIPGPVYHVDVRSMYPSIGLELPVPVSLERYHGSPESAGRVVSRRPDACCAHVRVRCEHPCLPSRRGEDIEYPVGIFDTHLAGPELSFAVRAGLVQNVYSASEYHLAPALAGFYQWQLATLDRLRSEGQALCVQWLKRVGNGLVGKFGEPGRRWVPCPLPERDRTELGPYAEWTGRDGTRYRRIGWYAQRLERHGESYWSIPAIAGWITSVGRVRLGTYHQAAGRANVWYVDTDALLCNQGGYDGLLRGGYIRDGETGYLRTLGCYRSATIHGIRHYQLGDTIKCAGVPHGAIREGETREEYFRRTGAATETPLGRLRRMRDGQA